MFCTADCHRLINFERRRYVQGGPNSAGPYVQCVAESEEPTWRQRTKLTTEVNNEKHTQKRINIASNVQYFVEKYFPPISECTL